MHQGSYTPHLSASHGDPRGREARRATIFDAMRVIQAQQDVDEIAAYSILVEASVEARSSVRDTALRLLTVSA